MLRVFCPSCKTPFDVDQGLIGQKGLCPTCGAKFLISQQEAVAKRIEAEATQPMVEEKPATAATESMPTLHPKGLLLAVLVTVLAAGLYWALVSGKAPHSLEKWLAFFGEMHPMLVHFPAALIPVLAVLSFFGGRSEGAERAQRVLLWVNFLASAAAILLGACSAMDRGASENLRLHTLFGLSVAGLSFVMLIFHTMRVSPLYTVNLVLAVLAVSVTGHFGANMSHGDLLKKLPWLAPAPAKVPPTVPAAVPPVAVPTPPAAPAAAKPAGATMFDHVILPILKSRCIACHGEEKSKGDLRLDSYQALLLAGESTKPSILPGNPAQSESLVRIKLAPDHEDHMPPEKKPQATADETEVLTWWVQNGASATITSDDLGVPGGIAEKIRQVLAALPKDSQSGQ